MSTGNGKNETTGFIDPLVSDFNLVTLMDASLLLPLLFSLSQLTKGFGNISRPGCDPGPYPVRNRHGRVPATGYIHLER